MEKRPVQVLLVDDETIVRKGVAALLRGYGQLNVIGEAASGSKAIELVKQLNPDVVLIDLLTPRMEGIEIIEQIAAIQAGTRILAFDRT